jgi:hypothetical protein
MFFYTRFIWEKSSGLLQQGFAETKITRVCRQLYVTTRSLRRGCLEKQWKAVYLYEKDDTFEKAAKTNNTTPQNIFSAYQRSNFVEVKKVEKIISKMIFDQKSTENNCFLKYQMKLVDK